MYICVHVNSSLGVTLEVIALWQVGCHLHFNQAVPRPQSGATLLADR